MSIFSALLVLVTLINIRVHKKKNMLIFQTALTAFVCTYINVGYFIDTDFLSVDYNQAAVILQLIVVMIAIKGSSIFKLSKSFLLYLLSLTITIILLLVFPANDALVTGAGGYYESFMLGRNSYLSPSFTKFTVFFYALAIIFAYGYHNTTKIFDYESWKKFLLILSKWSKALIVIVIGEFVLKNFLNANIYFSLIKNIFGEGVSTYTSIVTRGSLAMLQGLTREGSHFSYGMMITIILLYASSKIHKSNKIWICIAAIELILSGSFTAVWCIVFLYLFFIVNMFSGNRKGIKKRNILLLAFSFLVIISGAIIVISSQNYTMSRLSEVFDIFKNIGNYSTAYFSVNYNISSSQTRFYSIVDTFVQFLKRPIWGLGLGTTYCYSDTMLTLAEIGIVGVITYVKVLFDSKRDECWRNSYNISSFLWIICCILVIFHSRLIIAGDMYIFIASMVILYHRDTGDNKKSFTLNAGINNFKISDGK